MITSSPEYFASGEKSMEKRSITIDGKNRKGSFARFANLCVGSGHAVLALRSRFRQQLERVQNECGFKYLRFHGIFNDDLGVCFRDSHSKLFFNWQYIDEIYDMILDLNMKPFIELGFMPSALASDEQTVFWWQGNVTKPQKISEWEQLVISFATHLKQRYGEKEVATWFFEVWNEPDLPRFFTGTQEDYWTLYESSARALKSVCSDFQVGGPAVAINTWIPDFITHCHEKRIPLDFISAHTYGVIGELDEFGTRRLYLNKNENAIADTVRVTKQYIENSSLPHLPLHFTEWNASYSSRDPIHDSYIQAPFILSQIKLCSGLVQSMSYWTFSDIFEEAGIPPSPFHGGFGLLNLQGLAKPTFFSYRFLNQLAANELHNDDPRSWFCYDKNTLTALLWDYSHPQQDASNQEYFIRDLPTKVKGYFQIYLNNIPSGPCDLQYWRVGYQHNDVYSAYRHKGNEASPTPEELSKLAEKCSGLPEYEEKIIIPQTGTHAIKIDFHTNDIIFLRLNWLA